MLVADAQRAAAAQLLLDLQAALLGIGILHVRIHGGEVDQHAGRQTVLGRMFGNTGAPVCVGERLTLTWLVLVDVVVLPPESSALASARSGTRS